MRWASRHLPINIAGTLAYGQQRRVEIARAVAVSPAFLLLDEPTAGMNDAETTVILRNSAAARRRAPASDC